MARAHANGGGRGWQLSPELRAGYELFSSATGWDVLNQDEEQDRVSADEEEQEEKTTKKKALKKKQQQPLPTVLSPPLQHRTRAARAPDEGREGNGECASDKDSGEDDHKDDASGGGGGGGSTGDQDAAAARAKAMRLQQMWEALGAEAQQRYAQLAAQSAQYRAVLAEQRLHQKAVEAAVRSAEVFLCWPHLRAHRRKPRMPGRARPPVFCPFFVRMHARRSLGHADDAVHCCSSLSRTLEPHPNLNIA
jgi:hypothetical protein